MNVLVYYSLEYCSCYYDFSHGGALHHYSKGLLHTKTACACMCTLALHLDKYKNDVEKLLLHIIVQKKK